MVLMGNTEEDRKALIAMLGKLYITANSTTEKLHRTTRLVIKAIDEKIAQDAPSRNALNKLHLALSKVVGEAGKVKPVSPAGGDDGLTMAEDQGVEIPILANEEEIGMEGVNSEGVTEVQDSLLEELLDDEDDIL